MAAVALTADTRNALGEELALALRCARPQNECRLFSPGMMYRDSDFHDRMTGCIYLPSVVEPDGMLPNLAEAEYVLRLASRWNRGKFVLLSSALIYGIGSNRPGLVAEEYCAPRNGSHRIPEHWNSLETLARRMLTKPGELTILRLVTILPSSSLVSQTVLRDPVITLPGHDPMLQFLSLSDLSEAMSRALESELSGTFNVAPDAGVPLHAAARIAGSRRLPVPRTLQRLGANGEALEYLRYPWTLSNSKIKNELGFLPRKSSVQTLLEVKGKSLPAGAREPVYDEFGMDEDYIRFYGKTLFKILSRYYWRIESCGLEHIPRQGPAILAGTHRGFMPFDGVMMLNLIARRTGRIPRFLTHPGLFKFPFLANFMTKLGGVLACKESAEHVLAKNEIVAIFPEGIQGAFLHYRKAYQVQGFGRHTFVKLALRNRAPIVPFVIVGSAEIFPILAKINSRSWTRYTEWPCIPLTPTFPLIPVPLPSKWHIQFLPPIHVESRYGPDSAREPSVVKAVSVEVRTKMQEAIDDMVARRRSIFWGSIFQSGARHEN